MHNDSMKEIIRTESAPAAIGPYSQAVRANGFVFLSGQIPLDPGTGTVESGSVTNQTRRIFENIKAVLEAAGLTLDHVVKTTVFLRNMSEFAEMNEVYGSYFGAHPPARSTVEVSRLPRDVSVEIEVVAICQ